MNCLSCPSRAQLPNVFSVLSVAGSGCCPALPLSAPSPVSSSSSLLRHLSEHAESPGPSAALAPLYLALFFCTPCRWPCAVALPAGPQDHAGGHRQIATPGRLLWSAFSGGESSCLLGS
ncbi:hypothetical protein FKM82_024228 [Ascaphus truei]